MCSMSSKIWHPTKSALAWVSENTGKHPCQVCGEPVRLVPSYYHLKGGPKIPKYCSQRCVHESQRKPAVTVTCSICGKTWEDYPSKAARRSTCSRDCYRLLQRQRYAGHGNPNYRGGIQAIRMMIRNSPLYDHFRSDVLHRDGFTCTQCGIQAEKRRRTNTLDVHHVVSVNELLSKIFDPANGISLCPDCHTATHQPT